MPIATGQTPHPHLPPPLGVLSEWQRTVRQHPLLNSNSDAPLPQEANVVIVGSGMCGAVVANSLLKAKDRPAKVVVLEAREICSGASGRNAGHCRPDPHRGFTNFAALHGDQEARAICESESLVLNRVDKYIKEHKVECEWLPRRTYDACMSDEFVEYSTKALDGVRKAGSTEPVEVLQGDEAKKAGAPSSILALLRALRLVADLQATRVDDVRQSFGWDAATLNPAQLTLSIHTENLSLGGYDLFAWSPVHNVTEASDGLWNVHGPRGVVKAGKVVFATNAYSDALLPELEGLITPMRAQAVKLGAAPAGAEAFPPLAASYSLRYLLQHFYSVAPRPDKSIILGTSRGWQGMPPEVFQSIVNTVDDSGPHEAITQNALDSFVKIFPGGGWTSDQSAPGGAKGFEYSWTGIIGMTPDAVPFIGDVPDKPGQYVAAGYNGHGMARIFLCAPTLAQYMLTGEWADEMPEAFKVTPERISRLRKKVARKAQEENESMTEAGPPLEKVTIA